MATWLVERYWPGATAAEVESAAARLRAATPQSGVCYLGSAYLLADDTVLCLFEAAAADEVVALNEAAGVALDRVGLAVLVDGDRPRPRHAPAPGRPET